jgi:hypothetical protein
MTFNLENQNRVKEDIVFFENFLSPEDCERVIKYWEHSVEKGTLPWAPISFYDSFASNLPDDEDKEKFGLSSDFFTTLQDKIQEATEICRGDKLRLVSYHAQKWVEGAYAGYHSDNTPIDSPEYNSFERSKWAAFLYLNDDFEGGVLNFRDHDISLQPKTGMLAAFAGGHHNIHEVQMITKGTRLTIGSFWDNEEATYTEEKQAFWETDIAEQRKRQAEDAEQWAALKSKGERLRPGPDQTAKKDVALKIGGE